MTIFWTEYTNNISNVCVWNTWILKNNFFLLLLYNSNLILYIHIKIFLIASYLWNPGGCQSNEEGSCCARKVEEKVEEFHRTQDQMPVKEVCSEDALKGEKEGDL